MSIVPIIHSCVYRSDKCCYIFVFIILKKAVTIFFGAYYSTVFGAAANPCVNDQEFRVLTISCGGYVFCENRTKQEVICETGKVLERDSMACVE